MPRFEYIATGGVRLSNLGVIPAGKFYFYVTTRPAERFEAWVTESVAESRCGDDAAARLGLTRPVGDVFVRIWDWRTAEFFKPIPIRFHHDSGMSPDAIHLGTADLLRHFSYVTQRRVVIELQANNPDDCAP